MSELNSRYFLELALKEATSAFNEGNYPIGSIITDSQGNILSQKHNQSFTNNDVSAHAEIMNLREIGIKNKTPLIMFTSLEPCFGCSFFIARSSIFKIYSALKDPHMGGISDLKHQEQFVSFFNKIEVINEPYEDLKIQSKDLMKNYFLKLGLKEKAQFYS